MRTEAGNTRTFSKNACCFSCLVILPILVLRRSLGLTFPPPCTASSVGQFWSPSEAMKRPLESAVNASPEKLSEEYKQLQELQERRHALEGEIAHINCELSEETAHRKACEKRLSPSMPQESRKALTVSINVALERETALGASLSKLQVEKDRLLRAEIALSAQLAPRDAEASAASRSGSAGASSQAAGTKARKRRAFTCFRLCPALQPQANLSRSVPPHPS